MKKLFLLGLIAFGVLASCSSSSDDTYVPIEETYPAVEAAFGSSIDLNNLGNYANQNVPAYITKNNGNLNL